MDGASAASFGENLHMDAVEYEGSGIDGIGAFTVAMTFFPAVVVGAVIDAVFDTGITNAIDRAYEGVMNFIGGEFGRIEKEKEKAVAAVRKSLDQAQKDNQDRFLSQVEEGRNQVRGMAMHLKKQLEAEYQKLYDKKYKNYVLEQEQLDRQMQQYRQMHVQLQEHLHRLDDSKDETL